MTIREAIDAAMAARDVGADPARVLAEHGYPDLPVEAFSSALLHFAERAPLGVADALSPIVTRISPVPFEPEDLPDSLADDLIDEGADAYTLFAEVGPTELDHLHATEPDGFDDFDDDAPTATTNAIDDHDLDDGLDPRADAPTAEAATAAPDQSVDTDDDAPTFGDGHETDPDDFDTDPDALDDYDGPDPFDDQDLEPDEAFALADEADAFDPVAEPGEEQEALAEHMAELAESMSDFRIELDRLAHDDTLNHLDFDN